MASGSADISTLAHRSSLCNPQFYRLPNEYPILGIMLGDAGQTLHVYLVILPGLSPRCRVYGVQTCISKRENAPSQSDDIGQLFCISRSSDEPQARHPDRREPDGRQKVPRHPTSPKNIPSSRDDDTPRRTTGAHRSGEREACASSPDRRPPTQTTVASSIRNPP